MENIVESIAISNRCEKQLMVVSGQAEGKRDCQRCLHTPKHSCDERINVFCSFMMYVGLNRCRK